MFPRAHISTFVIAALAALLLVAPTCALAAGDLPDAIDDPVAAVHPDDAPAVAPEQPAPEIAQITSKPAATSRPAPRSVAVPAIHEPVGSLPFTGTDPRQLVMMLLIASTAIVGGVVALAWARVTAQAV